jgi:glycosyltransferase involved in cell wall biosynthesis
VQQPVIADYRMGLFLLLREKWGERFNVYGGEADFNGSPTSTPSAWRYFTKVNNVFLIGNSILWQRGVVSNLCRCEFVILNANIRILSNLIVLILRRVTGRKTILWGHAHGRNQIVSMFRGVYLRLGSCFVAYTNTQEKLLKSHYPWLQTYVAPNACIASQDCSFSLLKSEELNRIIYVGRLIEQKKPRLLLEAFRAITEKKEVPDSVELCFVGDGPERAQLESLTQTYGLVERVTFAGHVSEIDQLRVFYASSFCSVSAGYVGLSATQSFSFGVPMLVADKEFHSPEIEACREGFNAQFFNSDSVEDLGRALREMYHEREYWAGRKEMIVEWTKTHYSFEAMCATFVEAVKDFSDQI